MSLMSYAVTLNMLTMDVHSCRLGFSVFLNNPGDRPTESFDDFNEYMPEYCQMNLDYAGKHLAMTYAPKYVWCFSHHCNLSARVCIGQ